MSLISSTTHLGIIQEACKISNKGLMGPKGLFGAQRGMALSHPKVITYSLYYSSLFERLTTGCSLQNPPSR